MVSYYLGLAGTGNARGGLLHGHSPGARRAITSLEGGDEETTMDGR